MAQRDWRRTFNIIFRGFPAFDLEFITSIEGYDEIVEAVFNDKNEHVWFWLNPNKMATANRIECVAIGTHTLVALIELNATNESLTISGYVFTPEGVSEEFAFRLNEEGPYSFENLSAVSNEEILDVVHMRLLSLAKLKT